MDFQPGHTVGIDLGTTFSCIAYLNSEGNPVALANEDDEVETPSMVLLAESGHVIVGPTGMRAAMEDPQHVVDRIKRKMGDTDFKRHFDGRDLTPEFLSALILKKLKQDAEKRIGPIGNAVITVPYHFNDVRRKATQDAGRIAGLNVIDIINEPTAATLTYAWHRGELGAVEAESKRPRTALVYDLGGGTFDVTLVRYTPTHFQVLGTDGDVQLGGLDWNDRLLDHVAERFQAKHGVDPRQSPATVQVLRHDCDQAKIALSKSTSTSIYCRHEGKSLSVPVTRDEFEEMTADLLQRTIDTTELVLEQSRMQAGQLDAIVLVGGSSLMPRVPQSLEQATGQKPFAGLSPHTTVAQGAAIHAAILEAKFRRVGSELTEGLRKHLGVVRQDDVNSHSLGVVARDPKTGRNINHIMIRRNTQLPTEARQVFQTNEEGQQRATIQVVEGDAPDPEACSLIGNCTITNLPRGLPKGSLIEVIYSYDDAGRVKVRAIDKTGGRAATTEIERGGGLRDTELDAYTNLARQYLVE